MPLARVFLRRAGLKLEADEGLIAYHPCVMARFDHVRVARVDVGLGPSSCAMWSLPD